MQPEAKIEGRVEETAGKGVAGVRLLLRPKTAHGNYHCLHRTVSEPDGRFCFQGVWAYGYSLQVPSPRKGMADWVIRNAVNVAARAGETTDGVKVFVNKGGFVEVVVRDPITNRPLKDSYVLAIRPGFRNGTYTNAQGRVRIRAPIGKCKIGCFPFTEEVFIGKGKTTRLEFLKEDFPIISGMVRDEKGRPVADTEVMFRLADYRAVSTNARGKFKLKVNWIESGRRYLFARHLQRNLARVIEIKDQTKFVNVTLRPALTLSGRVADQNGQPIPAARVKLSMYTRPGGYGYVGQGAITDNQGYYEIPAIPPAIEGFDYYIGAGASGYGNWPLKKQKMLNVSSENRVELEPLVLPRANLSISGTVVNAQGKAAPYRFVNLRGPKGKPIQPANRSFYTNSKGEFLIKGICKGLVRLQAGRGSIEAQAGDKNVKIVLGQKGVHSRHISLVGKPLPDMSKFNIVQDAPPIAFEKILVCFWDFNQRPSRHLVTQLNQKAASLA